MARFKKSYLGKPENYSFDEKYILLLCFDSVQNLKVTLLVENPFLIDGEPF